MNVIVNGTVDGVLFENAIGTKIRVNEHGIVLTGEEGFEYIGTTILVSFEKNRNSPFKWWIPEKFCTPLVIDQYKLE